MLKGEVKEKGVKNGNESAFWIILLNSTFKIITISVGELMTQINTLFLLWKMKIH